MSFVAIAVGTAGVGVLGGAAQAIFSGKGKAQRNLDEQINKSPKYQGSKPINDYYNEALNRYNVNPYQSAQYQLSKQNAERGTATGLAALQGRGSALAGVNKLVGLQDDNLLKAGVVATNEQNNRFNQLGNAVGMQNSDDRFKFQNNELNPYSNKLNALGQKSSAANARFDAGLSNIYGSLTNGATILGNKKSSPGNVMTQKNKGLSSINDNINNYSNYMGQQ